MRLSTDWLGQGDVVRLQALFALGYCLGDLATLLQGLESGTCYPAVVNGDVVGLDEAPYRLWVPSLFVC